MGRFRSAFTALMGRDSVAPAASIPDAIERAETGPTVLWPETKPNWWQLGLMRPKRRDFARFGPVYACVKIIAEEVAKLPVAHFSSTGNDTWKKEPESTVARVLQRPNAWQTRSDFFLNLVYSLLFEGNAYAVGKRDRNGDLVSLAPLHPGITWPYIVPGDGSVFYRVSQSDSLDMENIDPSQFFPARDVLHIRLFTPRHPLIGETPLVAAADATLTGLAINRSAAEFFSNRRQPSGFLRVPKPLNPEAALKIKAAWEATLKNGGTAIIGYDGEWKPISMSAVDSDLVNTYRLTVEQIAQILRVPLFMLGDLSRANFNNVENLTRAFYQQTLSFYLEHIEAALNRFFGFDGERNKVEFDVDRGLLRADMKTRFEAFKNGVQGGILAPNDARRREGLPPVPGGEKVLVQQQMIPVDQAQAPQPPAAPVLQPRALKAAVARRLEGITYG